MQCLTKRQVIVQNERCDRYIRFSSEFNTHKKATSNIKIIKTQYYYPRGTYEQMAPQIFLFFATKGNKRIKYLTTEKKERKARRDLICWIILKTDSLNMMMIALALKIKAASF